MKFKLDENIGRRGRDLLLAAGHDVATVREQALAGAEDEVVFRACVAEGRALVTLDHDFGSVLRFPPQSSSGIVLLELPPRPAPTAILQRVREFLSVLQTRSLGGELWIVEPGRVRVHQNEAAP